MNTNRRFLMKAENKSATFVAALLLAATLSNRALGRRSGIAAFYLFALLLSLGTIEARAGLVDSYSFDETSGTIVHDSVGTRGRDTQWGIFSC